MADETRDQRGRTPAVLTIAIILGLLAASVVVAVLAWRELGEVPMGLHGWLALTLGVVATAGLGVGLMSLLWFSHRRGYDERAGRDD